MHNYMGTKSVSLSYVILLGLLAFSLESCALNNSFKWLHNKLTFYKISYLRYKPFSDDNPIYSIVELKKMEAKIADKDTRTWLYDSIANAFAVVGEYSKSLEYMDRGHPTYQSVNDSEILKDYRPQNAIKFIESIADSNQVIFINEAHNVAIHRAFSIRLLKILYDKGFRYFAAETLKPDTDLNNRGYPLIKVTGEYTNEPVYGDLVRTALKLGYTVIPYENTIPCKKPITTEDMVRSLNEMNTDKITDCQNHRESQQALNLYNRILKKNPSAKIFVHAGYGHIQKRGAEKWTPMGAYFQEITGIEPFSIDQESMREHSAPQFEKINYKYIIENFKFTDPIILQSSEKKIWGKEQTEGAFDIFVFHPRTKFIHGRPDWQLFNGSKTPYFLESINTTGEFPYLISAYIKSEAPNAVPIDQIMLSKPGGNKPLFLPEGHFVIKVKDKSGKLLETSAVTVKKNKSKFSIVQNSKL